MKKQFTVSALLGWVVSVCFIAISAVASEPEISHGGLESLRGNANINELRDAEALKQIPKDRNLIDRNYVHQPPLIPHDIRGYKVDLKSNKCLSCHGWKYAGEVGATKISPTHFVTREGITLSDVSPGRYFCLQCHVPQADANPLVTNEFVPVDALNSSK